MSGFKRFVSLLSASLMALGGVSASGSVDVLKRKDAGKVGVPLPNISKKNKEKKNKKIVGNGKKAEIKGDVKGLRSDSGVKNIDRVLSGVPDGVARSGLSGYIAKCKEKNGENLIRWENIWRSVFVPGSYASNSKQVIRARGTIEAFYNDAEALDLVNKFVSDPNDFSNKAKIDDLIGKLSARSWCEYVGSWGVWFCSLIASKYVDIKIFTICSGFDSKYVRYVSERCSLEMSEKDIENYLNGIPEAFEKWNKKFGEACSDLASSGDKLAIKHNIRANCAALISFVGVELTCQLFSVLTYPMNYDSQKVWGKKEAFEKVLQAFKK